MIEDLAMAGEQARQHAEMLGQLGSTLAEYPQLADLLSRSPSDLLAQVLGVTLAGDAPDQRTPNQLTRQEQPAGP